MVTTLARHASGIDDSPLVLTHEVKSISQETTFAVDIRDEKMLTNTLSELSERVGKRLRRAGLCGTTVKQKIRWSDFTTLTRQVSFETPIDQDKQIYQAGLSLFKKVWKRGQSVRLIGVGVSGLSPLIRQLTFWDEERDPVAAAGTEKERRLQTAIDQLRKQFGDGILFRGRKGP
jgi:DNA polymerase-4